MAQNEYDPTTIDVALQEWDRDFDQKFNSSELAQRATALPPLFPAALLPTAASTPIPTSSADSKGGKRTQKPGREDTDRSATDDPLKKKGAYTATYSIANKPLLCLVDPPQDTAGKLGAPLPLSDVIKKQRQQDPTFRLPTSGDKEVCLRFLTKECGCRFQKCNKVHLDGDPTSRKGTVPDKDTAKGIQTFLAIPDIKTRLKSTDTFSSLRTQLGL
jgi:hypothetical protein